MCVLKEGGGFLQSFEIGVFADGTGDETIGEFAGSVAFERTEMRLWLELSGLKEKESSEMIFLQTTSAPVASLSTS